MAKFVVDDLDNDQAFGPYDSEEEAEQDLLQQAVENGWPEIIESATHSGWLSDGSTARPGQRFGGSGLALRKVI